eukprot:Colp12_sorted_trinity150504_noHs@20861
MRVFFEKGLWQLVYNPNSRLHRVLENYNRDWWVLEVNVQNVVTGGGHGGRKPRNSLLLEALLETNSLGICGLGDLVEHLHLLLERELLGRDIANELLLLHDTAKGLVLLTTLAAHSHHSLLTVVLLVGLSKHLLEVLELFDFLALDLEHFLGRQVGELDIEGGVGLVDVVGDVNGTVNRDISGRNIIEVLLVKASLLSKLEKLLFKALALLHLSLVLFLHEVNLSSHLLGRSDFIVNRGSVHGALESSKNSLGLAKLGFEGSMLLLHHLDLELLLLGCFFEVLSLLLELLLGGFIFSVFELSVEKSEVQIVLFKLFLLFLHFEGALGKSTLPFLGLLLVRLNKVGNNSLLSLGLRGLTGIIEGVSLLQVVDVVDADDGIKALIPTIGKLIGLAGAIGGIARIDPSGSLVLLIDEEGSAIRGSLHLPALREGEGLVQRLRHFLALLIATTLLGVETRLTPQVWAMAME